MSSLIETLSKFYYIDPIDENNLNLSFDEGSGEVIAEVAVGDFTMTELASAIQDAMNLAGDETYVVTFLRDERKFKIECTTGTFSLLISGGSSGNSIFPLIGFTGSDTVSAASATGNGNAGTEYKTQFALQSYTDQEDFQKALYVSVNKSASGLIEVVKFGTEKFFEFNIMFATNIVQLDSAIRSSATGLTDLRLFMRFATTKRKLEFMPNADVPATFYTVLLEKTEADKDGTGYQLKEMYTKNLPGYFETGELRFRLVEES